MKKVYHSLKRKIKKPNIVNNTQAKRIVIYLHALDPLDVSWIVINEHSEIQQTVLHSNALENITAIANQYPAYVITPGEDVVLMQAEVPKLTRERLMQALPYTLEDKLIDDVHELHFAVGKYTENHVPVAVVHKNKMAAYLHLLEIADIHPFAIIPATLSLPWTEKHWHASCEGNICLVRTEEYSGFASDRMNLATLLELRWLETPIKPDNIHLETTEPLNLALESIRINETILPENHLLEKNALLLGTHPYINLLQGIYRPKQKATQIKKLWTFTGLIAAVWIGLLLISNITAFFMLTHAKHSLEQSIDVIYRQQFPSATSVVAPRERMEAALKKWSGNTQNDFLNLVGLLSVQLSKTPAHINHLDYRDGMLNLALSARSFDALDAFMEGLTKEHLKVKQQNAAVAGTEVKANIIISKGSL